MKVIAIWTAVLPLCTAIWPIPSSYSHGSDVLWIERSVSVSYGFPHQNSKRDFTTPEITLSALRDELRSTRSLASESSQGASDRIVHTAIQRMRESIFNQSYVPWMFYDRDSDFEPSSKGHKNYIKSISLVQTTEDPKNILRPRIGEVDESYSLDMDSNGEVTIRAPSSLGLSHGLTTFSQLFYVKASGNQYYTKLAPVKIKDKPKFAHRGLNLDTSRTFKPVPSVKKTIDALAFNKMNRLHIHMTDAQSWPLVVPSMPELAKKGAYQPDMVYEPEVVRDIQEYGALRGVEVIIETDMPGHITSIGYAYPNLIAAFNIQPDWSKYALEPPSGVLKLNSSAVYDFLGRLWKDLFPRLAPYTSYYHTGGDEIVYNAYLLDPGVKSNNISVLRPLLQKFADFNFKRIREQGMIPMVWQEMLLDYGLKFGKDVIVQTWESDEAVLQTVQKGHKALVGNYEFWYLDCGKGQWLDFAPGEASAKYWPYLDYCDPLKNWRLMYSYDPLANIPTHLQHLVVGGETHIWSEQTDAVNLDRMVWPRASAAGEVLWSGSKDAQGQNRSQIEASPRLSDMRERLVAMGVAAEPVRMPFCSMGNDSCVLYH